MQIGDLDPVDARASGETCAPGFMRARAAARHARPRGSFGVAEELLHLRGADRAGHARAVGKEQRRRAVDLVLAPELDIARRAPPTSQAGAAAGPTAWSRTMWSSQALPGSLAHQIFLDFSTESAPRIGYRNMWMVTLSTFCRSRSKRLQ